MVIVGFIFINQFVVWFLRVDYLGIRKPFIINVPLNEKKAQLCIFIYMFLPSGRECTLFCNLQSRARTYSVLVIGLYELLDPTT
jgi:hypothetical protein